MVKVKLGKLRSTSFQASLQKALNLPGVPVACSLRLRRVRKKIESEVELYEEELSKLLLQYCELEDGKPKLLPLNDKVSQYVYKPGCKVKHEADFKKLAAIEIELPVIPPEDFADAISGLVTEDFCQLEFIDNPEAN